MHKHGHAHWKKGAFRQAWTKLNVFMGHLNLGERTIKGCLEAYSCKHAGTDKRLSLNLENEMLDYLEKSSDSDSSSPVDLLLSRSSRKALIYLVLTLYQMYPDYDFSAVKAHQFFSEESWDTFTQIFSNYMFEASKVFQIFYNIIIYLLPLLEGMYEALDEVVKLAECEIYVYNPNPNADPFLEEGAIVLLVFVSSLRASLTLKMPVAVTWHTMHFSVTHLRTEKMMKRSLRTWI
ncbi:unnamed protein product, partial [Brassica oleracea var. botrytis]